MQDVGFLPQFHLIKVEDADMQRLVSRLVGHVSIFVFVVHPYFRKSSNSKFFSQFVPRNFMSRCHLISGQEVALVDCMGRIHKAIVESCCGVNFLGEGWAGFLKYIGASRGDSLLLMFKSIRTCKVFDFHGDFGWQKYPFVEKHDLGRVLLPRQPGEISSKE